MNNKFIKKKLFLLEDNENIIDTFNSIVINIYDHNVMQLANYDHNIMQLANEKT
jgi:hypothetical protein